MERVIEIFVSTWPFWVFVVMIAAVFLLLKMYGGRRRLPYCARGKLVTKSELRFYRALQRAVEDDWAVFAMVRIADLLRVEQGVKNRRGWINKILSKHVDFVLCDLGTLEPVLCIELDDKSHQRKDRIERDIFVDAAFESAGLPLLRIPVQPKYPPREIRQLIEELL